MDRSASPVRRIPVRTEQQRDVEPAFAVSYAECNFDDGIERIDHLAREVIRCVENQTVGAWCEVVLLRQQLIAASVLICAPRC